VGWKQYFRKTFDEEVEAGTRWGDLEPYQVTHEGKTYNTVGFVGTSSQLLFSPKIQHPQGVRTRITIKYFFWVQQGATGRATLYIVFYKDAETSKNPDGHDLFGVEHSIGTAPETSTAFEHEFVMEYDGTNKIVWYVDGRKLGETTLEVPLVNFAVVLRIEEASGGTVGILIYEVAAEYYDVWEDWFNMIYSAVQWMVPIMMVVMIVPMIISIIRAPSKKEEERRVVVTR